MEAPLALYRRYRPETFAEVIGQDHVTEPLRAALANNRVNHAYLFSGPRGCGKTTSARILARALNCEKAPIADPCGECESCRDLARGGPGSIDVIEIDAASHGGVDDARDLREKAFFAPVRSRYKVYIIDEAHMVSPQGFNALLKLVEEPPPHLRFIFATTEPEKVIPTIRSRTHHYPFRLIPPRLLSTYLGELCELEGVTIEPAALPLVVRAGGGSARDTMSVLDQLLGGAGPEGVTHALATGLLGYTPDTLLDEVVDAFSAGDGASVFGVVDKVIETGQDPRRFAEDLLRRLRDLVIIAAVPDASATGLIDVAEDAAERLTAQATRYGVAGLSRAADLFATGLTEMRGATAPRLLLELICARVLLPGADDSTDGLSARLDRIERRVAITGGVPEPAAARGAQQPAPAAPQAARTAAQSVSAPAAPRPASAAAPVAQQPSPAAQQAAPSGGQPSISAPPPQAASPQTSTPDAPAPGAPGAFGSEPGQSAPGQPGSAEPGRSATSGTGAGSAPQQAPGAQSAPQDAPQAAPAATPQESPAPDTGAPKTGLSLSDVRQLWPDIVEATKLKRRVTWIHLTQNAQVVAVDDKSLTLGFANAGARESFVNGGSPEIVRQAAIDVVGSDWKIEAIVDPGAQGPGAAPAAARPQQQTPQQDVPQVAQQPSAAAPTQVEAPAAPDSPPPWADPSTPVPEAAAQPTPSDEPAPTATETTPNHALNAAREAIQPTRTGAVERPAGADPAAADADVSPDDPELDSSGLSAAELLKRELGAQVIQEIKHD
ncbi:DNA polymerase III subunit gamma and tau [Nocardioides sp. JQ2195]|uniref:DNA polymerase III subunit gamma and tau n=1 Tax=Nocardioides sp. JQ2195 TaxID=2592334 RepID=UPI00143E1A90|nr:DNA polymerase III subunit gamma and tau [Nocardioides sp. JQ2195]QIX28280.1 DNA polymerase III subunit gamma and tau [Nocardioides sp. JQ2195]